MVRKKIFKKIIIIFAVVLIVGLALIFSYVYCTIKPLFKEDFKLSNSDSVTTFYSKDLEKIENNYGNKINLVDLHSTTINAFLSIEDKDFYNHNGINLKRILGATINNIKSKKIKEGASTITQQLVKNKYLSNEKTLRRKIKEAYISFKIEKNYSKEEILTEYLNTIYFGNGAYGIFNASKKFFNKLPKELTLGESCVLAGCINSPTYFSPINNLENSRYRRNLILREMLKDKKISQLEFDNAIQEEIELNFDDHNINDFFLQYTLDEASNILKKEKNEILSQGYKIYTYQDTQKQKILNENINNQKYYPKNSFGKIADGLSIIIDNDNHSVSAISGRSKYNLVNFKRQPGSLIKPIFTYAPAYEEGIITPITQIKDEKINICGYEPNNVGNKFYDYVSVKDSIAKSLNIPTIKITQKLGIDRCKDYANGCGIEFTNDDIGYALSLGGMNNGVTIKEITDAYSVFLNDGCYFKSSFIDKIVDKNNITIYDRNVVFNKVFSTDTAYLMTNSLMYAVNSGTSKKLSNLNFEIAGKTGTVNVKDSNLNTDAYSLAYTSKDIICCWFGNFSMNEEYNLLSNNNGGTYATEVVRDTFEQIYQYEKPSNFNIPDTIVKCNIDNKKLIEDHIVTLANSTPERYIISEFFSKRYIPEILSDKFNRPKKFNFDISAINNSIQIKFDCHDYNEYEIYRNNKLVKEFTNFNNNYIYIDKDLKDKNKYSYFIKVKNKYSNEVYDTDVKSIYYQKDYSDIDLNNDFSFLFA